MHVPNLNITFLSFPSTSTSQSIERHQARQLLLP